MISLRDCRLKKIDPDDIPKNTETLDLSNNFLKSLEFLPDLPLLNKLVLDSNPLFTLKGAFSMKRLIEIELRGTPLSILPYYRLTIAMAFGRSVSKINDTSLTLEEIELRDEYAPICYADVIQGYVIINLKPLILYNPIEKKEKRYKSYKKDNQKMKEIISLVESHFEQKNEDKSFIDRFNHHINMYNDFKKEFATRELIPYKF